MISLYSHLAAWWNLTEASGTRYSADGLTPLTDYNTVTQAAGKPLYAANFVRAQSEYLYCADNPRISMASAQDFGIVCWVRMASIPSYSAIALAKGPSDANNVGQEYSIQYNSDSTKFEFRVGNGTSYGTVIANALGTPNTGIWYFVYVFHDAVSDVIGIEVNTTTYNQTAWTGGSQDTTNGFAIGRFGDYGGATNMYWDGQICGVGIWKRTLTYQERLWLYNAGRGRLYPFDGQPFLDTILSHGGRQRRLRTA